jgi:formiminotetrahydrofolate cyclodeaminase
VSRTLAGFVDELSTESPAPGGGSVAALCGALSAALAAMVANLTVGRKGQEDVWEAMRDLAERAQVEKDAFLRAVDEDAEAFNRVMDAMRAPAGTTAEKAAKAISVEEANRGATLVPLGVLARTLAALELARETALYGNPNSVSDAGAAAAAARAAAEGAFLNVLINLKNVAGDPAWVDTPYKRAADGVEQPGLAAEILTTWSQTLSTGGPGVMSARHLPHHEPRRRGLEAELAVTERPGHARDIVQAHGPGFEVIVVVGGDGTLYETIQTLDLERHRLGLIPWGAGTTSPGPRAFTGTWTPAWSASPWAGNAGWTWELTRSSIPEVD